MLDLATDFQGDLLTTDYILKSNSGIHQNYSEIPLLMMDSVSRPVEWRWAPLPCAL